MIGIFVFGASEKAMLVTWEIHVTSTLLLLDHN